MDSEGISDGSADRKVEIRVRRNGRKDKVIVEKSAAEGLPEGWIKKLVITNRAGRKTRKDPFFIDPKSGYIFQSFKDASRYVETGYIGIYARKLKESNNEDDDSRNGKTCLPLESMEKRSADDLLEKEKNINIYVRNSKRRNLISSDELSENCNMNSDLSSVTSQVLEDLGKKEEAKSPIGKQSVEKRVTRSQAKASKNEEDLRKNLSSSKSKSKSEDTVKSRLSSASSQGKESLTEEEEDQDSPEKRITRSKATMKKNELSNSINRRTSKRLAGIELEPTPELKTRTKAQRVVPPDDGTAINCMQLVNLVATDSPEKTDVPLNMEVAKASNEHSSQKPNSSAAAAALSNNTVSAEMEMEKICKPVSRNLSIDKKKMKTPLLISEEEPNPVFNLIGYKQNEEMSPVSPLSRHTSATKLEKTAVSQKLRRSSPKANKVSSPKATAAISPLRSSNKSEHHSENFNAIQRLNSLSKDSSESSVVRGECSEVMEKNTNSFSSAFDSTLAYLCKDPCIAFAIKTLTGESLPLPNTAAVSSDPNLNHTKQKGVTFSPETPVKPGFSSELPGEDIWKDPCIDFAIKTLTGAIPIGLDEADVKPKSQGITITTAKQEQEGKQSRSCDYLLQHCSKMEKKTVGKSDDLRFP